MTHIKKLFYILLILLFAVPAFGATYYVDGGGSGAGTVGDPWSVTQFNARSGSEPDNIYYFSGTITTPIVVSIYGTSGHPVILDGYVTNDTKYMNLSEVAGRAKVDVTTSTRAIDLLGADYITIQDFEMTDFSTGIKMDTSASIGITIKRCYMYEGDSGIYIGYGSYNITIGGSAGHGNVIKNTGVGTSGEDIAIAVDDPHDIIISYNHLYANSNDWGIDGIMNEADSYDVLVEYNSIHGHNHTTAQGENGIDLKRQPENWIIRYNEIYDHDYESDIILNGNTTYHQSADQIYIYGNFFTGGQDAGIHSQINSGESYDNIYIFSNIFSKRGNDALKLANAGSYNIYNNTFAENSQTGSDDWDAGLYQAGTGAIIKNNIFYKNRPNDASYNQMSISAGADEDTTADYNWYYWPGQTSSVRWGDAGNKTVAELASMGGSYGNQEVNGSDEDPGLTDPAGGDYTISSTSSGAYGAGFDMRSASIAAIVIQGITYTVRGDEGLGADTVFPGDGTIPTIDKQNRDTVGRWDIGAFIYGTGAAETDDPTPNPATWVTEPGPDSTIQISMVATTGVDATPPISYNFNLDPDSDDCAGAGCGSLGTGGTDSGWQSADTTYSDDGLQLNKCYCYSVQMKDSLENTGTASAAVKATTWAATPGASTLANATDTTLDITEVDENSNTAGTWIAVQCVSSVPNDADWVGMWVHETTGAPLTPLDANGWQAFETWDAEETITGLNNGTEYCFQAKAINSASVETSLGAEVCLSTTGTHSDVTAIGTGALGVKFD